MAGVVLYIFSALAAYLPAALVLTSYGLILLAIGRMRSAAGKEYMCIYIHIYMYTYIYLSPSPKAQHLI